MNDSTEGPRELPVGWAWAIIDDLCAPVESIRPELEYSNRDLISYVDLAAITDGKVTSPQTIGPAKAPSRARQKIRADDTLFSCVRVYLENISRVPAELDGEVASTAFAVLRPKSGVDPDYLYWLTRRASFIKEMVAKQRGNSPPAVLESDVKAALVPVPPSVEQHRIAAKIEELFGEIEAGEQDLGKAREGLAAYRRTVLKAAVTGELTRDWRKKNELKESGQKLLTRIITQRSHEWEDSKIGEYANVLKSPPSNWKKLYKPPIAADPSILPSLPESWGWATIDELTSGDRSCAYGVLQPGPDVLGGVPLIRVGDINAGKVDVGNLKQIAPGIASQYARTRLRGGELLITLVGTIGRTAIAPESVAGANTARAVGVVPLSNLVNNKWVEIWFRSPTQIKKMIGQAHEVARKTLNLEDVRAAVVALPPRFEQEEIVEEVERLFAIIEDAELEVKAAHEAADRARQSILVTAFSGKLVPQDLSDEPANVQLERLRAAKAMAATTLTRRRSVNSKAEVDGAARRRSRKSAESARGGLL